MSAIVYLGASRDMPAANRLQSIIASDALAQQLPTHDAAAAKNGDVVVELCDGKTKMQVKGLKPGHTMNREQALAVTRALMADWARQHPDQHWEMAQGGPQGGAGEWSDETNGNEATPPPRAPIPTFPVPGMMETVEPPAVQYTAIEVATSVPTVRPTHRPKPRTPVPASATITPAPSPSAASMEAPTVAPTAARSSGASAASAMTAPASMTQAAAATPKPTHAPKPTRTVTPSKTRTATPTRTMTATRTATMTPTPAPTPRNPIIGGPGRKQGAIQQGDTYASFTQRDTKIWQAETDRFIQEGKEVFHDANKLGSTIGISCDMCHPDAANTHPETYPKYQVQLQRVALLRDMIEWCIENPVKGKTMDPNDERLRAMEAYILSQRKGVPLDYGKH